MTQTTSYNAEQIEALDLVVNSLAAMTKNEIVHLKKKASSYLDFRREVALFSGVHLLPICKKKCYDTGVSDCCTKEGIIIYFTDMVLNVLYSDESQIVRQKERLSAPRHDTLCVYLGETGCIWSIKPIVCEMFFCDTLLEEATLTDPLIVKQIEMFKIRQKAFTWPDQPVLFNTIEKIFLKKNVTSSLMYYHFSPGLRAVKKKAGVT